MTDIAAPAGQIAVAHGIAAPPAPWRLLLRRPTFVAGAAILLFWVVCAIFGASIAPHDPLVQSLLAKNSAPSGAHLLGTDSLGRDVLSRLIMGYVGGVVDTVLGRVVEAVLALPVVIVALLFIVAVGPSPVAIIVVIGF